MAFTAVTALVGGATATTALVLGAMAEIGTIMTIVGGVTGNKDLMKLGGVIGLVGGIGGALNGAATAASTTAAGANEAVANAGAWQTADIAAQATDVVASPVTQSAINGTELGALGSESALTGLDQAATQGIPGVKGFDQPANGVASEAAVTMPEVNTLGPAAKTNVADAVDRKIADSLTVKTPGSSDKGGSFFSGAIDYIKNPANKELVNSGVKLLGGMMQGANQSDMFDQKMQFAKDQFNYQVGQSANISKQNKSKSGILTRI